MEFENKLISLLSQIYPKNSEVLPILNKNIDWDYIYKTAERHRIIPILFTQLKSNFSKETPESVFKKFQNRFQEISTYNFARTTQLIKLVKLLQEHNFQVLSYKGMTLAKLAYRDITLRQFTDIDLLIRKKDFFDIKELLSQIECRPAWDLTDKQEKSVLKLYYEYPFFIGKSNTLLEVHWDFIESFFTFDFDTDSLWQRTTCVDLYGKETPTLSPEDYLVILCSHGSKHFWTRLSWVCDVDRIITNSNVNWDKVILLANKTNCLRMLYLGIYLSKKLLNTRVPTDLETKVNSDKTAVILGNNLISGIFNQSNEPDDWKEMARTHMKMRENVVTKFTYAKRLFTTKLIDKLFLPMGRPQ